MDSGGGRNLEYRQSGPAAHASPVFGINMSGPKTSKLLSGHDANKQLVL